MKKTEPIVVTILRHGAVDGRANIFRGVLDDMLSAQGAVQMQRVLMRCPDKKFDAIASSPLRRCHDFAAQLAARYSVPLQVMPAFSELAFGDWEGLMPNEASAHDPNAYQAFHASFGEHAPPNGESLESLRSRVVQGWHRWMTQDSGANRLLITHAGVMRALLIDLFAFTPAQVFKIALPEAACLRISWLDGHPPFLLSLN